MVFAVHFLCGITTTSVSHLCVSAATMLRSETPKPENSCDFFALRLVGAFLVASLACTDWRLSVDYPT